MGVRDEMRVEELERENAGLRALIAEKDAALRTAAGDLTDHYVYDVSLEARKAAQRRIADALALTPTTVRARTEADQAILDVVDEIANHEGHPLCNRCEVGQVIDQTMEALEDKLMRAYNARAALAR